MISLDKELVSYGETLEEKSSKLLYGRKMKLTIFTVTPDDYSAEFEPELEKIEIELKGIDHDSLKVTFDVNYPGLAGWYFSEICIYNFNESSLMQVLETGASVRLEAGYVNGNYGEIFQGFIYQCLFEREGIVDYKLTLRCVDGNRMFSNEFCAFNLDKGRNNQVAIFNAIHSYSQQEIKIGNVPSKLRTTNMPRGITVFSNPAEELNKLLKFYSIDEAASGSWFTKNGVTKYFDMDDEPDPEVIQISPDGEGGLIGTPVQTEYGCNFVCLLNANIELNAPRKQVKLNMATLRGMKADVGAKMLAPLDEDQQYQVIGVRHKGDTRGNEWYTYVTGINKEGAQALHQTSRTR